MLGKKNVFILKASFQLTSTDQSLPPTSPISSRSSHTSTLDRSKTLEANTILDQSCQNQQSSTLANQITPSEIFENQESSMSIDLDFPMPDNLSMGASISSNFFAETDNNPISNPANSSNILDPQNLDNSFLSSSSSPSPITQSPRSNNSSAPLTNQPTDPLSWKRRFKSREEQASARLNEYEDNFLLKFSGIENYDTQGSENEDESDSKTPSREGFCNHHHIVQ